MSSRSLEMIRGQRQHGGGVRFTSKTLLACLAFVSLLGSAASWWGVQSQLTDNLVVASACTTILVLAPPSLTSFMQTDRRI